MFDMYVCMSVWMYVVLLVCLYVCMHVCMYVFMYVCMYACMHACMYVCIWYHFCFDPAAGRGTSTGLKEQRGCPVWCSTVQPNYVLSPERFSRVTTGPGDKGKTMKIHSGIPCWVVLFLFFRAMAFSWASDPVILTTFPAVPSDLKESLHYLMHSCLWHFPIYISH